MIVSKEKKLLNVTAFIGLSIFILCLLGTFLVRSGLLVSVHSFANDPMIGIYILIFVSFVSLTTILIFILKSNQDNWKLDNPKSQGIVILLVIFLLANIFLIIGTFYPVIYDIIYGAKIEIGPNYYAIAFIPLTIIAVYACSFWSYTKSIIIFSDILQFKAFTMLRNLLLLLCALGISIFITKNIIAYFSLSAGLLLLFITIIEWAWADNFKIKPIYIGHLGLSLFIIAVTLNFTLKQEIEFTGIINHKVTMGNYEIRLKDIKYAKHNNYFRQIAEFEIFDSKSNMLFYLKPEHRLYPIEKITTSKPHIYSFLNADIYAVLNNIKDGEVHAQFYHKPAIFLLWLSLFIIACAPIFNICKSSITIKK